MNPLFQLAPIQKICPKAIWHFSLQKQCSRNQAKMALTFSFSMINAYVWNQQLFSYVFTKSGIIGTYGSGDIYLTKYVKISKNTKVLLFKLVAL